jgi:tubulin polyglutamylase TTLL4
MILLKGYWGKHISSEKFKNIKSFQKINHFPMSFEIGRKDNMYKNWEKIRTVVSRDERIQLDYCPETYILPRDRVRAKREFTKYPLW